MRPTDVPEDELLCFQSPNYCGEFDNSGAIMDVDEELMCNFKVVKGEAVKS